MSRHRYTAAQARWLREHAHRFSKRALAERFNQRFGLNQSAGALGRKVSGVGLKLKHSGPAYTGTFRKGRKPGPEARCRKANRGSFRKGSVPASSLPVGSTRVDPKSGELMVRTAEGKRYRYDGGGQATNYWKPRRGLVWEAAHGPVPPGFVVIRLDADPAADELDNFMLVARADLVRINHRKPLHELPDDRELRRVGVPGIEIADSGDCDQRIQ